MAGNEHDFLQKLRATFRVEAEEHLQSIAAALREMEDGPPAERQRAIVDTAFRAAHSLKGAARAVDRTDIEGACEALEDLFVALRREPSTAAPVARLRELLDQITSELDLPVIAAGRADGSRLPASPQPSPQSRAATDAGNAADGTVRIGVAVLDRRLVEAEEMLAAKLASQQRAADLKQLKAQLEVWRKEYAVVEGDVRLVARVAEPARARTTGRPQPWNRILDFLDWNREYLQSLEQSVATFQKTAEADRQTVGRLVDDLLENSKRLLLLPFGTVTTALPRMVRDLGHDLAKDAGIEIRGEHIALDKRILEELRDPLLHLIRNALDHGIEPPEVREQSGKSRRGQLTVSAAPLDGNAVRITVADDGAGIDRERVKSSAVDRGVLAAETGQQLADDDAARLIFEPDVSTRAEVTRVSGRGLGLAIVREKIEGIGGKVAVESEPGRGTRFLLTVPAMLATFRGVLIESRGRQFIVPTHRVERVLRLRREEIRGTEQREMFTLDGRTVALVRLSDILALPFAGTDDAELSAVCVLVVGNSDQRIGLAVDEVVDEQEVLVKPLRPPLVRVRNVAGVTVLGSGQMALVLDVTGLIESARAASPAPAAPPPRPASRTVLVAEDSLTSRLLIKSILEGAGYQVRTAVDGLEAFSLLRSGHFDALVTDVEMPRLNGFDLTARIRADARLAKLPVVLVTALATPEDRLRGIDVAADAYIVKGSFDQRELLDAVRRLL